jgi:hypothetical protein
VERHHEALVEGLDELVHRDVVDVDVQEPHARGASARTSIGRGGAQPFLRLFRGERTFAFQLPDEVPASASMFRREDAPKTIDSIRAGADVVEGRLRGDRAAREHAHRHRAEALLADRLLVDLFPSAHPKLDLVDVRADDRVLDRRLPRGTSSSAGQVHRDEPASAP